MSSAPASLGKHPSIFARWREQLLAHVRTPVLREGYALVLSAALASALGLVYWVVAARTYSAEAVGLNSAVISTMTLVSGIAQLNLVGGLMRFVPDAGRSTFRLVAWSYLVSLTTAALAAPLFLLGVHWWTPKLGFLTSGPGFALWFVGATLVWCVFSLQDAVLTGLRRAAWVPVDNALFGVVKLALLLGLASALPRFGIFASWTLGTVVSVLAITLVLGFRLIPARVRSASPDTRSAGAREVGRFVAADYAGGLSWIFAITVIPLAVTQRLGAAENAYYSLAWVMATPLYLVSLSTSNSLVVSLVNERARLREYPRVVLRQTARLVVPGAIVLAAGAPLFLRLFGDAYAREGATTLRLLALSAIPNMVTTLYLSVWRAEQRLSLLVWSRVVQYATVVILAVSLLGREGIRAPALAWLGVQTVAAVVLLAAWPQVLRTEGSRLPLRLRGVRALRNAAADSGLLTLSQEVRWRSDLRRRMEPSTRLVSHLLRDVPELPGEPLPTEWVIHDVPRTSTDSTVILVGPPRREPRAVIKLAETAAAASALVREADLLEELAADPRLTVWRRLLPEVLAAGEIDGEPYLVERVAPGIDASRVIGRGSTPHGLLKLLADPIKALHRLTGAEIEISRADLLLWVDVPIATVMFRSVRLGQTGLAQVKALETLREELHDALLGRKATVGWVHGDYTPGNVVVASPSGPVTGIIDWELASARSLTALDLVQLVVSARMVAQRRELGEIVMNVIANGWSAQELEVLAGVESTANGGPGPRELVLLAWLRHTAAMLSSSDAYAGNRLWTASNLETTLAGVA